MLLVVLGLFTVLLFMFGQAGEIGVLATAVSPLENEGEEALSGIGGLPEDRFDEARLLEGVQLQVWESRLFVSSNESPCRR
jgi:hypothetical protein